MQIGMNDHHELVHIKQARFNEQYICPECSQSLIIKISQNGRPFFAHYHRSQYLCGESQNHELGKTQIFQWANQRGWVPQLEVYLPAIKQRPDILLQINNKQIALEYQCSPLSLAKIKARNRGYQIQGISVRWILGPRYQRKLYFNKIAQFTQQYQNKLYLYFWDSTTCRLVYRNDFATCSFNANWGPFWKKIRHQTNHLQRRRLISNSLINFAYQNGRIASCCPLFVHDIEKRWPVMQQPIMKWRLQTLLMMEKWPIGKQVTLKYWQQWLFNQADWLEFPCLDFRTVEQLRLQTINDWQKSLVKSRIIIMDRETVIYRQRPHWFSSIEEKYGKIQRLTTRNRQIGSTYDRMVGYE